jgi:hypothetical protein
MRDRLPLSQSFPDERSYDDATTITTTEDDKVERIEFVSLRRFFSVSGAISLSISWQFCA